MIEHIKHYLETINNDLLITIEALKNQDNEDALKLLIDIREDIAILLLTI